MLSKAFVPYRAYWSSPFCRWQGSLQNEHPLVLGAATARRMFEVRGLSMDELDGLFLGSTIYHRHWFYSAPWFAAMMGNDRITGPNFSQACATSATTVAMSAMSVEAGTHQCILAAT